MTGKSIYQGSEEQIRSSTAAESAQEREESGLREIFAMSIDMICIADLVTMSFIKINPAFSTVLGYTEEELLGESFLNFIHPDDTKSTIAVVAEKLSLGISVLDFENRYRRKDGVYLWLSWSAQPNLEKAVAYAIARDISTRKIIETDLQETRLELAATNSIAEKAHEFANNVINTLREPLLCLDQDLRVVTASRSFYEDFKVTPEETLGELIYNLGNKQWNIPRLRVLLEKILPQQSAFDGYQVEHDFANIGPRIMLLNARQVTQRVGATRSILLAIEDITERKAVEAKLEDTRIELAAINSIAEKAHEFADNVINTVREPLLSLDQNLRVITASRSFYEVFKVTPEETLGELIYNLGDKQWDIPRLRVLLENILPQQSAFDGYQVEHDFANIGLRTMLLNARQIERSLGAERAILLAIDDITERKAIEAGLESKRKELAVVKVAADEAHQFADSVINTVREPLISLDKNLRVVTASRSFYDFFKVKPEETLGQLIYNLGNNQWNIPRLQVLLEKILPEQTTFENYEVTHDFANIGRRTMLLNARQIKTGLNRKHGILLAIEDITERKWLELELLQAQKQKLDSLGVFAGGIAHDFNNVLTTILGNVSMAKQEFLPGDEIFEQLKDAEMASIRAQGLTNQLLTFAKGGAPVKELASISNVLRLSPSFMLPESHSRCDLSIAANLWFAEVDVGQISQVINNLVINADQSMQTGGIIQVVAENLMVDQDSGLPLSPGRYIKIAIHDQGAGISSEHIPNIFNPYFTTKKSGSGLGLASAHSIITKHSGHITAVSKKDVGTTFNIYLPASSKVISEYADPSAELTTIQPGTAVIKAQQKILVMDDEISLRKMMGMMLVNLGCDAEFANEGHAAIALVTQATASKKPYDAVILDLTIRGGLGGKDVIGPLLQIDPQLKAIVFSGYSDDPVLANFEQYGFKGMLAKPFKTHTLRDVLNKVLDRDNPPLQ